MDIEEELEARLASAPVVPLIGASDTAVVVDTANALGAGGLSVIEVVLRTDEAVDCMEAIVKETSGLIATAGPLVCVNVAEISNCPGAMK